MARSEVERQRVGALQGARDLAEALKVWRAMKSRSAEVENMLKGMIAKCDALKSLKEKSAAELEWLAVKRDEAFRQADTAKMELRQAIDCSASKPSLMSYVL